MDSLIKQFGDKLKIHKHDQATTNTTDNWKLNIEKHSPQFKYTLLKALLLKPSKSTSAIFVLAKIDTPININSIAKKAGFKEARVANEQFITDVLNVGKDDVTPFALPFSATVKDKNPIKVFVDDQIFMDNTAFVGFKAFKPDSTCFLQAGELKKYFDTIISKDLDVSICDFIKEFAAPATANPSTKEKKSPLPTEKKKMPLVKKDQAKEEVSGGTKQIGIEAKKETDFSNWYQQVVIRTEMLDYYDISGCYILRPWSFKIWKSIQKFLGNEIEELGVEDCYFPMFVTAKALNREKDHIDGFAPEVAWVTKAYI